MTSTSDPMCRAVPASPALAGLKARAYALSIATDCRLVALQNSLLKSRVLSYSISYTICKLGRTGCGRHAGYVVLYLM